MRSNRSFFAQVAPVPIVKAHLPLSEGEMSRSDRGGVGYAYLNQIN